MQEVMLYSELSQDVTRRAKENRDADRLCAGGFFALFKSQNVTEIERAEDALISLHSAGYIREAEAFGYPVGDGGEEPDCGGSPMLPRWLWSGEPEETEDGGSGKTFCEL